MILLVHVHVYRWQFLMISFFHMQICRNREQEEVQLCVGGIEKEEGKGRETEREREVLHPLVHSLEIVTMAGAGQCNSQKPGIPSRFHMLIAEAQTLGPFFAGFLGMLTGTWMKN